MTVYDFGMPNGYLTFEITRVLHDAHVPRTNIKLNPQFIASEFLIVTLNSEFRVQQNLCFVSNKLCGVSKTIWFL